MNEQFPNTSTEQSVSDAPNRVVPIEDFRGDPSRVLGHPSNPASGEMASLVQQVASEHAGVAQPFEVQSTPDNPDLITGVPDNLK